MTRARALACRFIAFALWLPTPGSVFASGAPYLVRDIESVQPARLPFDGRSWQLPRADLVASGGVLWTVSEEGRVDAFLQGGVIAQLPSGDAVVLRPDADEPWFDLLRTDGDTVVTLADRVRLFFGSSGAPSVAELGTGVVFNGMVFDPDGAPPRFGHWYANGSGPPERIGNYGSIEPAPPFGPIHCAGPVEANGRVLFCANEDGLHSSGAVWSVREGQSAIRLTPPGSQTVGMLTDPTGTLVLGLTEAGPFRSDGTVAGTEILPWLPEAAPSWAPAPVSLAGGLGWLGSTETSQGFWWLPPSGDVMRLLTSTGDTYLVGSTGDHVYLTSDYTPSGSTLSSLAATGQQIELGATPGVELFAPVGTSGEAVLGLLDEGNARHLVGSDGERLVTLLEGSRDHEGVRRGPARAAGRRDDGVLVGFRTLAGQTLPWLVRPGFQIERWRDLRLGGTASSTPAPLLRGGDRVLFLATTARGGTRLWQSQGSADTTRALMRGGMLGCRTLPWRNLVLASDRLVVGCIGPDGAVPIYELPPPDDPHGLARELGRVPGPPPTSVVAAGVEAVAIGHRVLVARGEISVFDTTTGTTELLAKGTHLTALEDRAVFLSRRAGGGTDIWSTDGTSPGTELLLETDGGWTGESSIVRVGAHLVIARDARLYSSDGTAQGTRDIGAAMTLLPAPPGATHGCGIGDDPLWGRTLWSLDPASGVRRYLTSIAGWTLIAPRRSNVDDTAVWFVARRDATSGGALGLWRCDGTRPGSGLVAMDLPPEMRWVAPSPDGVFLMGFSTEEQKLLRVSPDGSQIDLVMTRPRTINDESFTSELVVVGPHVFFTAADDAHGRELWALRWDHLARADGRGHLARVAATPRVPFSSSR